MTPTVPCLPSAQTWRKTVARVGFMNIMQPNGKEDIELWYRYAKALPFVLVACGKGARRSAALRACRSGLTEPMCAPNRAAPGW